MRGKYVLSTGESAFAEGGLAPPQTRAAFQHDSVSDSSERPDRDPYKETMKLLPSRRARAWRGRVPPGTCSGLRMIRFHVPGMTR